MGLPITPSEYGKLEEVTNSFIFRNSGQFRIPKPKREIAFTMAVDIQIQSVNWNVYENRKSNPPIEFYGYATFVEQDAIRHSVPIIFPRQRLYFAVQDDAIRQWNELAKYWEHWQLHRWNEIKILEIQGAIGIEDIVDFTPQFGDSNWIELPLREVYIKCPNGTQFEVQYTQYQPVPYEDPFGNTRTGVSNQLDGDKDNGLPEEGIQPRQNPANNPFQGNEPESPPSVESGFFLNPDKLDEPTASGLPDGTIYWIKLVYLSVANINGDTFRQTQHFQTTLDPFGNLYPLEVIENSTSPASFPCGGATQITNYRFRVNGTEVNQANWRPSFTWNAVIESGTSVPPDSSIETIANGWCTI